MGLFRKTSKQTSSQNEILKQENIIYPAHIAIIMDGNGRWAKKRGFPRSIGHRKGADNVTLLTEYCAKIPQIRQLTLYAFSTENWKRPKREVEYLFKLLSRFLKKERPKLIKNQVKFKTIGDIEPFSDDVKSELGKNYEITKDFEGMTLTLALNYGSQQEIIRATKKIAQKVKSDQLAIEDIDIEKFEQELDQPDMLPVDLLIRTSGEMRISNYLLWQISYAELYVTEIFWPDFKIDELNQAIIAYSRRDRRFGNIK